MYPPRKPEPQTRIPDHHGAATATASPDADHGPSPKQGAPGGASPWSPGPATSNGPLSDVDLEAALDAKRAEAAGSPDWKNSVAGLLELFGMANDDPAREALALAMGYDRDPADKAGRNLWLHAQLLKQVAASGGEMPDAVRTLARNATAGSTSSH